MVKTNIPVFRLAGRRARQIVIGCVGVSIVLIVLLLVRYIFAPSTYRQAVLIIDNPSYIVSFTPTRSHVTLVDVPSDTTIQSMFGYGRYSVGSLITLDTLDKRRGELIRESISNTYGIPLFWTVTAFSTDGISNKEPIEVLRRSFSWSSIFKKIVSKDTLSVPVLTWISYVVAVQTLHLDRLNIISSAPAIQEISLPDGSQVKAFDENKLDRILSQAFVDEGIRGEGITVSIYNTTTIPQVAQRVGRVLVRQGVKLIFIGNTSDNLKRCRLSGDTASLQTKTAIIIRQYLGCIHSKGDMTQKRAETGADLVVELGEDVTEKYR